MPLVTINQHPGFKTESPETILEGALRASLSMPHSCRVGRCSTCKCRVLSGSTIALHDEQGLTAAEKLDGWVLSCVRTANTDTKIQVDELPDVALPPVLTAPCRIDQLDYVAPDVLKVMLRLPPSIALNHLPGQYVNVIGHGGVRRSYSIASLGTEDKRLELHIRRVAGGRMSAYWFQKARPNDLLRLHGPLGTFFLRPPPGKDLIFLATGTGIAPVKAILELVASGTSHVLPRPRSVSLYWGGRTMQDHYWDPSDLVGTYVRVLSREGRAWHGQRGHVQDVLLNEGRDLSNAVVYACGSPEMIHGARESLLSAGLPSSAFYSDAFVCSAQNDTFEHQAP